MPSDMEIVPLTAAIGAEINGVDLRHICDSDIGSLREALNDYQVLVFRSQNITPEHQVAFAKIFGTVAKPLVEPGGAPAPNITVIETNDPKGGNDVWHSDQTFDEKPPKAGMLHGVVIPNAGGDTIFANLVPAYDDLSAPLKRLLDCLTATHSTDRMIERVNAKRNDVSFLMKKSEVIHPVVRIHPETGRKMLFVNALYTDRINELEKTESDALLSFLFKHSISPEYQLRIKWTPGSVVLWDEMATIHFAVADYKERRVMHRLMIEGERPFGPQA